MVSSNQRSINDGIRKVIGSSNRGFASMDPERQRPIVAQLGSTADPGKAREVAPPQERQPPRSGPGGKASAGTPGTLPAQGRR